MVQKKIDKMSCNRSKAKWISILNTFVLCYLKALTVFQEVGLRFSLMWKKSTALLASLCIAVVQSWETSFLVIEDRVLCIVWTWFPVCIKWLCVHLCVCVSKRQCKETSFTSRWETFIQQGRIRWQFWDHQNFINRACVEASALPQINVQDVQSGQPAYIKNLLQLEQDFVLAWK